MTSKRIIVCKHGVDSVCPAKDRRSVAEKEQNRLCSTKTPRLTEKSLNTYAEKARSQLDVWLEQQERHERVAVGGNTHRAVEKIEEFFKDVEENVKGDGEARYKVRNK